MNWCAVLLGIPTLFGFCAEPPPEPLYVWERQVGGVWCYHTLADPDCYPCYPGAQRTEVDRPIASSPNVYFRWRPSAALAPPPAPGPIRLTDGGASSARAAPVRQCPVP
jgi:hypothetical protein